ncbi:hypothetical protein ONS95_000523 [Cadophora gregata]|uniref:uncharacterized protein n=1 Tax=Cadophora gregata TaxID=51156 RepID=UPI0026DB6C9B|nr:uncharacterized protein ONS95_000523 [Cadophora gregata]KAK0125468.1 hypothetical protein ONS96_009306 [Cadophora gregata f. sp. sojae]KAK0128558.1 hypothetical protein ONS95_000523 [Cadophora gregata]
MSGYRPGHEQGHDSYIEYAAHPEPHPEERVYVPHVPDIQQHGGAQGLSSLHEQHLAAQQHHHQQQHQQQQHQQQQQHHHQQHQVYAEHPMAHHQSPQFGGGQGLMYGPPRLQQPTGTKRSRPDDLESEMDGLPGQQMHMGEMGGMSSQMPPQSMVGVGGYSAQQPIQYHTHPLPNQGHRSKMPRMSEGDSMVGTSGGAPSVVGLEGMPQPAPRPRGPKLKFTPEDDGLLVDLKENKSLTWKQIAEFFPGRSSGTLQVRYCTKLKAKTTQWTDETIQKLRTALHDYEQEKWRIVAQKVGTGFTSAACKEKAREL